MRPALLATALLLLGALTAEAQPAHVEAALERWIDHLERQGSITRAELDEGRYRFGARTVDGTAPILNHDRRDFRLMAILDLGRIGDKKAVPHLLPFLEDGEADVRRSAALAIGALGDGSAVPRLIADYRDGEKPRRDAALATLRDLGHLTVAELATRMETPEERRGALQIWARLDPQPLPPDLSASVARSLASALDDADPSLRQGAARLLYMGPGGAPAVKALVAALDDAEEAVRSLSADALRSIGEPAVPDLLEALRADRGTRQRAAAAAVLGDIRPATWHVGLRLLWAAHDPDPTLRVAARKALVRAPPGIIPPPLTARWGFGITDRTHDGPPPIPDSWKPLEPEVRARVERTLRLGTPKYRSEQSDQPKSVHAVRQALEHESPRVRQAAIWACEEIGPEWLRALAPGGHGGVLDDANVEVRDQAIRALGRMGPSSAAPLGAALSHEGFHHPHRTSRLRIIRILQLFGPDAGPAAPDLARAFADENPEVREEARKAIGALKTNAVAAIPTLVELSGSDVPEVSEPAAQMLTTLGRDLKKQGAVLWWVVPRVYWPQLLALGLFLGGWFLFWSRRAPPEKRWVRGVQLAALPLVVACPTIFYMVSRPWAAGFLPESLPTVLPLHLVATLSTALCVSLAALWASAGKAVIVSIKRDPIRGFRRPLFNRINVRMREALNISVRAPGEAAGDVRGMAPEAQQSSNGTV